LTYSVVRDGFISTSPMQAPYPGKSQKLEMANFVWNFRFY